MRGKKPEFKRKQMVIAGAIIAAVIVLLLTTLWLTVWSQPNKNDYEQAKKAVSNLDKKFEKVNSAASVYTTNLTASPGSETTTKAKTTYEQSVKSLQADITTIEDMKAISNDSVKAAYEAFRSKSVKFISYSKSFLSMRRAFSKCADILNVIDENSPKAIAAAHKKAAQDCLAELESLEKSDTKVMANYARDYAAGVRARQNVFDTYAAGKSSETKTIDALKEANAKLVGSLNLNALQKARDDASVMSELKKLKQVLDDQIKQAS